MRWSYCLFILSHPSSLKNRVFERVPPKIDPATKCTPHTVWINADALLSVCMLVCVMCVWCPYTFETVIEMQQLIGSHSVRVALCLTLTAARSTTQYRTPTPSHNDNETRERYEGTRETNNSVLCVPVRVASLSGGVGDSLPL